MGISKLRKIFLWCKILINGGALIGVTMTFYEALEIAMEMKGLRPVDVADRAHIHQSYISKLKSGHQRSVDWDKALMIIDALGMTPNEFYEIYTSDTTQN